MSKVVLENVGPVKHFEFEVPATGGVVVLRGRNGAGKSHILDAVQSLVTGDGSVPLRDGQSKGKVEGLGATIKFSKRTTRSGELEVESLVGDVDPAALVDPGVADPERADAARIKALLTLSGVQASPQNFVWNQTKINLPETETDPVKLAGLAAREYQRLAREEEAAVAELESQIARLAVVPVEYTGETDANVLEERLIEARSNCDALKRRQADHRQQQQSIEAARAKLAKIGDDIEERLAKAREEYAEAREEYVEACRQQDVAYKLVEEVKAKLAEVTRDLDNSENAVMAAGERHGFLCAEAERHAELRAAVNPEAWIPEVTEAELAKADQEVAQARDQMAKAALVRQNAETAEERESIQGEAERAKTAAGLLRTYAGRCEQALSDMVAKSGTGLFVDGGRLRIATDRGADELFAELSHGERWKTAIDVCVSSVGNKALIVIPQEAWEGIDHINRTRLADFARQRAVTILTAECGDGEIEAGGL